MSKELSHQPSQPQLHELNLTTPIIDLTHLTQDQTSLLGSRKYVLDKFSNPVFYLNRGHTQEGYNKKLIEPEDIYETSLPKPHQNEPTTERIVCIDIDTLHQRLQANTSLMEPAMLVIMQELATYVNCLIIYSETDVETAKNQAAVAQQLMEKLDLSTGDQEIIQKIRNYINTLMTYNYTGSGFGTFDY